MGNDIYPALRNNSNDLAMSRESWLLRYWVLSERNNDRSETENGQGDSYNGFRSLCCEVAKPQLMRKESEIRGLSTLRSHPWKQLQLTGQRANVVLHRGATAGTDRIFPLIILQTANQSTPVKEPAKPGKKYLANIQGQEPPENFTIDNQLGRTHNRTLSQ